MELIRADRRRVIRLLLASGVLVGGGLYLVLTGDDGAAAVAGFAALCFFGLCLLVAVGMLIRPPVVVAFGPEGIVVPGGLRHRMERVIPWSAVAGFQLHRLRSSPARTQVMVGVVPTDPDDPRWTATRSGRASRRLAGFSVGFSVQLMAERPEEVVERMRRYKRPLPLDGVEAPDLGI